MPAPVVGQVYDGYRYMGGDPNNQASWADASIPEGTKAAPQYGPGAYELQDGSVLRGKQILRGARPSADGSGGGLKEFQVKAGTQAVLMDEAMRNYDAARTQGYDPGAGRNIFAYGLEKVPFVGDFAADVIRDDPSQRGRAAELQYTEGALRALTGAAATEGETKRTARNMFRQPGEGVGVEPNKMAARERFSSAVQTAAGGAYQPRKPTAKPPPKAASDAYFAREKAGRIDRAQPLGTEAHPYVARSMDVANRLPKGSYVILPDGSFGVVE